MFMTLVLVAGVYDSLGLAVGLANLHREVVVRARVFCVITQGDEDGRFEHDTTNCPFPPGDF